MTHFYFDDVVPNYLTQKEFDAMTKVLRARLEQKRGRKHLFLHRHHLMPARTYAGINCVFTRGYSNDTVRVPYEAALNVLRKCDERFTKECVAACTFSLAL